MADPIYITATAFKARCLELMDEVATRRVSYVVTKHGKPVAELAPVGEVPTRAFGFMRGMMLEHGDIVAPDHEIWGDVPDPLDHC